MPDVREELKEALGLPTKEQLAIAKENFEAELPGVKKRMFMPLSLLRPSATNPRRKFSGIEELAATMGSMGVISSLVVRPLPSAGDQTYEIVAGGRRYLAAKKAGLKEVPVEIRMMTDSQVAEVQLVENSQREDLMPMEEADGFARLRDEHHYAVAQIASKIGKSKGHVHARLKLLALCPEARKALDDGRLDATVGVPLARLGEHKLQATALAKICPKSGEPMSSRAAIEFLNREFTHTLKGAPFDQKDTELVPVQLLDGVQIGGACAKCPNRSGSTPGLFDDVSGHDVCTTPACYQLKCSRAWKNASSVAAEKGHEVLTIPEGKKLFDHANELVWDSEYVLTNAPADSDPKKRTWKQLASKLETPAMVFLVPDKHLKGRECYRRDDLLKLLAKDQKWAAKEVRETKAAERRGPEDFGKEQKKRDARATVFEMLVDKAADGVTGFELHHLRMIALAMHNDQRGKGALERRQLTDATAEAWISEKATGPDLCQFIYEHALMQYLGSPWNGFSKEAEVLAKRLGIDLKEQEKFALQQITDKPAPDAQQPAAEAKADE